MTSTAAKSRETNAWAFLALALALFAVPLMAFTFRQAFGPPTAGVAIARELTIIACAALLIWIMRSRERLSLAWLGLVTLPAGRLVGWTLVTMVACVAALALGLVCVQLLGLRFGSAPGTISVELPMWVTVLVMLRAGFVEELFYLTLTPVSNG